MQRMNRDQMARRVAQELADGFSPDLLHRVLDRYAALCSATIRVNARDNLDEWFDRAPVAMIVAPDRPCNT